MGVTVRSPLASGGEDFATGAAKPTLVRGKNDATRLAGRCEAKGLSCPSQKKIWRALQSVPKDKVALAAGGKRAFHAARSASDPLDRSLRPLACGQVVHVDSTDIDNRHAPDLLAAIPDGKAKIYYALDGATLEPVAHVLIFGPARTDGLALLHRDYVRRHGREPVMYHFDRGPENRSHWVTALCEGHTHIRWSPAGGSQYNSEIELAVKKLNHQVSHRLIGSTVPDRAGRSVDGKFKSRKNAKTSFDKISKAIEDYLYQDYPKTEGVDGSTPSDRRQEAVNHWGTVGNVRIIDDDFLYETSVPVKLGRKVVANKGIRTESGFFVSNELTRFAEERRKGRRNSVGSRRPIIRFRKARSGHCWGIPQQRSSVCDLDTGGALV